MVVAARHPAIVQCGQIQLQAERSQRNLSHRLLQGDFEDSSQWNAANKTLVDYLELTANGFVEVVEEARQRLVNQFLK